MDCQDGVCRLIPKDENESITVGVLELSNDHVLLEWTAPSSSEQFQIDYKRCSDKAFTTLSDTFKSQFVKKKNLVPGESYQFRVKSRIKDTWGDFCEPITVTTLPNPPSASPTLVKAIGQDDGNFSIMVSWEAISQAVQYEIQMRQMNGTSETRNWVSLSQQLKGTSVLKKNLTPAPDYIFRMRALVGKDVWTDWSLVSQPIQATGVNQSFKNLLGSHSLIRGGDRAKVSTDSLSGKVVGIYFSGLFCPPCRQQTQMMIPFYQQNILGKNVSFEVVFVSADRTQSDYDQYLKEMPWLALDYNDPRRNTIMNMYQVSGVPRLMIFSPSARLITDNAAGVPMSMELVNSWINQG
jgi:thiol-disulfide isomerase/thioredoxin